MAHRTAAESLWKSTGLPSHALSRLSLTANPDPAVNSSFRLGSAAQTAIGLAGLSAAHFHELRTGLAQDVKVDARHAVLAFRSEAYYTVNNTLPVGDLFDPLAGVYKTKDGNWVRIHTNFPHHRDGVLSILNCAPTKAAVTSALLQWNSFDFEDEIARRGMVATAMRSFDEWDSSPQGQALKGVSPVELRKIADTPKHVIGEQNYQMPLQGVKVLDLTRVLAGPVCGRTLAEYGANVLLVTSPNLPALPLLDADTSRGKRTTQLDLTTPADKETLEALVKEADVFLQAYRPNGLAEKGFGVDDVVRMREGKPVVYASLRAYGWEGPWQNRRGFDSIVQTAMGFNSAEAEAHAIYNGDEGLDKKLVPEALPMQALDHAAGYLLAFGINAALCKTATEGGSWEVRVSLAAVGNWIKSFGRLDPQVAFGDGPPMPPRTAPPATEFAGLSVDVLEASEDVITGTRRSIKAIRNAANLSLTPAHERDAPMRLNANKPEW